MVIVSKIVGNETIRPNFHIEKIECRNNLLRNYGTKLAAIVKNSKFPIPLRNHITNNAK